MLSTQRLGRGILLAKENANLPRLHSAKFHRVVPPYVYENPSAHRNSNLTAGANTVSPGKRILVFRLAHLYNYKNWRNTRMRILFLLEHMRYTRMGGSEIQAYYLIEELKKTSHEIHYAFNSNIDLKINDDKISKD